MKLEIEHLTPYLPYQLRILDIIDDRTSILNVTHGASDLSMGIKFYIKWQDLHKPILRPLSDLTKEIEHNGERFVPIKKIGNEHIKNLERFESDGEVFYGWEQRGFDDAECFIFNFCEKTMAFGIWNDVQEDEPLDIIGGYNDIIKLFEWHFDVFGLIEKGLALDINTI